MVLPPLFLAAEPPSDVPSVGLHQHPGPTPAPASKLIALFAAHLSASLNVNATEPGFSVLLTDAIVWSNAQHPVGAPVFAEQVRGRLLLGSP